MAFFVIVAIATGGGGQRQGRIRRGPPTTTQAADNGASVAAVAPRPKLPRKRSLRIPESARKCETESSVSS